MTKNEALKIKHISQYCEEIGKDCDNCLFQDCFSKAEIKIAKSILGDWEDKEIYYLEEACRQGGVTKEEAVKNWNRRATPENKPLTNGDLIRSMGNEELAVTLACPNEMGMAEIDCDHSDDKNCCQCLLDWLNQPCEPEQEAAL